MQIAWDLLEFGLMALIFYCAVALLFEAWFSSKARHWDRMIDRMRSEDSENNG